MAVYIEHEHNGLLLRNDKQWVKGTKEARCFPTSLGAIEFCVRNGIRSVRLLVRSEGQPDYFVQPFGPLRREMEFASGENKKMQDQARAEALDVEGMVARETERSSAERVRV
jgi:hypothetical protein